VSASDWISPDELHALLEVMTRFDVSELTQVRGEGAARNRLTIRRGVATAIASLPVSPALATQVAHATPLPAAGHHPSPAPAPAAPAAMPVSEEGVVYVTSPLVGTFYRAPSPDAASFADVGTHIRPGQRLCIVEAMKLMNEIESEIEGTILEILVENGKPVEYGQKLFKVKKA
jgi:acetyl-CoA carboxylase biotin carboxyl carrier protein